MTSSEKQTVLNEAVATGGKHVAFFLPDFGGGGAERVQLNVMRELVRRGHRVDLVLALEGGSLLPLLPPEVRVIPLRARRLARSLMPLVRYLKAELPDSFHANMWPLTVIAPVAHRLAHSKALLMVSEQVALSQQYGTLRQRALVRATARLAWPLADHRVACAFGTADDIARLSGLPRDRFEVIYNPTSPPDVIGTSAEAEALWGGATHRLITVGRLTPQKNHALLIRAFAHLLEQVPGARLMLVGQGELLSELKALSRDLGVEGRVTFAGFHLSPWPFLASSDVFVLSSDYEGFANVVAEALYAGLNVVSTNCIAGPAEILEGGRFGRLVPVGDETALADAMLKSLSDTVDGERQRTRAEAISGKDSARRYADLLTGAGQNNAL